MKFVNFLNDLQRFDPKLVENIKSIYLESVGETANYEYGAGVLLICPSTKRLLLGLRSDNQDDSNVWCGFGGKGEPGETPIQTAMREVWEETKIHPRTYKIITPALHINQNSDTFKFHNYLGIVDSEIIPKINDEHKLAKWLSLPELSKIPLHRGLTTILTDIEKASVINKYIDGNFNS